MPERVANGSEPGALGGAIFPFEGPAPAGEIELGGAARRISFSVGEPVIVEPLMITGRKAGVVGECAVRIGGQLIVTIGQAGSTTEALQCYRLIDAGALPPSERRRMLGLIYLAGSPNADFRVPAILVETGGDRWSLDDAAVERLEGNRATRSIGAMAKALGGTR